MLARNAPQRHRNESVAQYHPFPSQQLFILAVCRICEPIAFMSIFPYVYFMIQSFNTTTNTHQLAVYVGMVTSAFAFAEFSSGVIWGRLSDRVGRKPVLLTGLAGTALSMIVFGFAQSLPMALLGRALGGLLNGNMGVLQTTVAEIVTVKEHQPRAYSIMPFVWCLGSIIGPALGGTLAQPSKNYPSIFPNDSLFAAFPFLLPNLVCAVILGFGVVVGILFLEETHQNRRGQRDAGIEAGKWLLTKVKGTHTVTISEKNCDIFIEESGSLMVDEEPPTYSNIEGEQPPGYQSTEGSPRQSSSRSLSPHARHALQPSRHESFVRDGVPGIKVAFNKQVVLNIAGFGILAYHSISFDQLMPVFLSEPIADRAPLLPFKFTGGFGYSTKTIGIMLSIQGLYSMLAQLVIFPFAVRHLGPLRTFRFAIVAWPLLYVAVPYLILLPRELQSCGIYVCLLCKITLHVLAFPSNAILLTNSAPSLLSLGIVNGVAASTASLARACGPTITGILHSWGLELGSTGLAWWASGVVCALGAVQSMWLEESDGRMSVVDRNEETNSSSTESLIDPSAIEAAISAVAADQTHLESHSQSGYADDVKVICIK